MAQTFLVRLFLFIFFLCVLCNNTFAQDSLQEVKVQAKLAMGEAEQPMPLQTMDAKQIQFLASQNIAEATRFFAGVQVQDYGGVGGLKTINVRSLGGSHTLFVYDGLPMLNTQAGQVDMGSFVATNIAAITLFNPMPTSLLQPAKLFGSSGVLSAETKAIAKINQKYLLTLQTKLGSFGFKDFAAFAKWKLRDRWEASLNFDGVSSKGNYPYRAYEKDTIMRRKNTKAQRWGIEGNLIYRQNDSGYTTLKIYSTAANRQLPGAVVLFANNANEKMDEQMQFLHFGSKQIVAKKLPLLFNFRLLQSINLYIDPDFPNNAHRLENNFKQSELYFSLATEANLAKQLNVGLAQDYIYSKLNRTDSFAVDFQRPVRNEVVTNFSIKYHPQTTIFLAALTLSQLNDSIVGGRKHYTKFSPTASMLARPFSNKGWAVRLFYKRSFRMPTFNDLYFTLVGNTNLKPELADQYNVGLTYAGKKTSGSKISFTLDAYVNKVANKILAVPRLNLYQWSMQNIGKAQIVGLDVNLDHAPSFLGKPLQLGVNFTLQAAKDLSDKSSIKYNKQLPYTPVASGSFRANYCLAAWEFGYNNVFTGGRYISAEQTASNHLKAFLLHNFYVGFKIPSRQNWQLFATFNNLLNHQYEIIKYYPMPGFNFKLGANIEIKK